MPKKLEQKLKDDSFITWASYSNIAGIVASALMIAASFYGLKIQLAVLVEKMDNHLAVSTVNEQRFQKMVEVINNHESRITTLEAKQR